MLTLAESVGWQIIDSLPDTVRDQLLEWIERQGQQ